MVAGGKVKKTKRTAPKSNDIYLKLLVKVRRSLRLRAVRFNVHIINQADLICVCDTVAVVPVFGEENGKQV